MVLVLASPDAHTASAITINTTVGVTHWGKLLTNRGAAGALVLTLPAPTAAVAGAWFLYRGVADQNMSFTTATVDTLVVLGDATADSLTFSTGGQLIGALALISCDGTSWFATALSGAGTIAT